MNICREINVEMAGPPKKILNKPEINAQTVIRLDASPLIPKQVW